MLKDGDPIPERDHIARWCLYSRGVNKQGKVQVGAFYPRPNEDYLSGNRLEFYSREWDTAISNIRTGTPLKPDKRNRIVVLQVTEILDSIMAGRGHAPAVTFKPKHDNQSHVSIGWENWGENDHDIANELFTKVTSERIYQAKIK
jgi:hypothetical protein